MIEKRNKKFRKNLAIALFLGILGIVGLNPSAASGGNLEFSTPQKLATLAWSNGSNHGVPSSGPEWLLVDNHGGYFLESDLDFAVYSHGGKYVQTLNPIDKSKNFYGFTTMEALPGGEVALLSRLESPEEQWGKDDYEEHTKPGTRLIVLKADGRISVDKELVDPDQPHSNYYLENGVVYSVHDDGSYLVLDSHDSRDSKDPEFGTFSPVAYNLERWLAHIKGLPVFQSGDKSYHDTKGQLHEIKGASSSLMGRPFVEGLGPLAEKSGKIYYLVVCDKNQDFINAVFVEDTKKKNYALIELMHSDQDLDMAHGHTVFVDEKGNIYEGVGKKDGYRIYEWKIGR